MGESVSVLKEMVPQKAWFIGIDSDGCAFDTMEIKQKECFCPCFIRHFALQAASKYARQSWEFVNLYSKDRGCNRFIAVVHALDLLRERAEVKARGIDVPLMNGLRDWLKRETKLGEPALKAEIERNPDPDLKRAYDYSVEANQNVARLVFGVPPFPHVRESLKKIATTADAIVVSQTPGAALEREWKEHGICQYVRAIAGQELGTKGEHIALAAGGKYPPDRILMIGDAPGDYKAAKTNGACFFPIIPGNEERSWELFENEGLDRFLSGRFTGEYQERLLLEFDASLPTTPPWGTAR